MNHLTRFLIAALIATAALRAAEPAPARKAGDYAHGPDSKPQEGVPKGKLLGPLEFRSKVIANTVRQYWIYVPAQYTGDKPACLLVFQDGQRATNPAPNASLRVPQVLENLVHKKDIPVTIGLFITPGQRGDTYPATIGTGNANNRAQEYDALSDAYARMLIDEMIPELKKTYKITDDPAGRAIGGTSSGAICAWTVAWHRPDQFRKVISMIGSYTSIGYRPATDSQPMIPGGDLYPTLIRKSPIKPIRIFLQDGSADLDNNHGSWFLANQQMLAALNFANTASSGRGGRQGGQPGQTAPASPPPPGARYDVKHEWGDGAHSDQHGGVLLPDILRWMFRDWPKE